MYLSFGVWFNLLMKYILPKTDLHYVPTKNTNQPCKTWKSDNCHLIKITNKITSHCNGKTQNHCQTRSIVYCLECIVCHEQYIGKTGGILGHRIKNDIFSLKPKNITAPKVIAKTG